MLVLHIANAKTKMRKLYYIGTYVPTLNCIFSRSTGRSTEMQKNFLECMAVYPA